MSVSAMKKLTAFAFREDAYALLHRVLSLRCVQLADESFLDEELQFGTFDCSERQNEARERLSVLEQAIEILSALLGKKRARRAMLPPADGSLADAGECRRILGAAERTLAFCEEKVQLRAEMKRTEELLAALVPWLDYDAPLNEVETQSTETVFGSFRGKKELQAVLNSLEEAGAYLEIVSVTKTKLYLAITFHRTDGEHLMQMLAESGFSAASFPQISEAPSRWYDRGMERLDEIRRKLPELDERLMDLSEFLEDMEMLAAEEALKLEACMRLQALPSTQSCAVLEGWFPASMEETVFQSLSDFDCAFEIEHAEEGMLPPSLRKNKGRASRFGRHSAKNIPSDRR